MNNQTPIDVRDTRQYSELSAAHAFMERVLISIRDENGGMVKMFNEAAERDGKTLKQIQMEQLEHAMNRVANWIPCQYGGEPQCECECPMCEKEDSENRFNFDGMYQ